MAIYRNGMSQWLADRNGNDMRKHKRHQDCTVRVKLGGWGGLFITIEIQQPLS